MRKTPPIAMIPYASFVRPHLPCTPDDRLPEGRRHDIAKAEISLSHLANLATDAPDLFRALEVTGAGILWLIAQYRDSDLLDRKESTERPPSPFTPLLGVDIFDQTLIGGVYRGLPYVRPGMRGRGIGAEIHLICDRHDLPLFNPSAFSASGRAARQAAHRKACLRALEEGKPLHATNLMRYEAQKGTEITA